MGWTLEAFARCDSITSLVLVGAPGEREALAALTARFVPNKPVMLAEGGATRQESVRRGLASLPESCAWVAIHDAARCCITPELITQSLAAAPATGAASVVLPVSDTLVRADGTVVERDGLDAVQTPQVFSRALITEAHERAAAEGVSGTDDAGLVRRLGHTVTRVIGTAANLKVTHPADHALATAILQQRQTTMMELRIGHGYDVHQLVAGRPLWLGGVPFPEATMGLLGHSDADALLHALCDALLGAAGLGDIGTYFPPSDNRHKDRPSIEFVQEVAAYLARDGWQISNIDISVLAEAPRLGPRVPEMRQVIAAALGIAPEQVNIKATTNEKLGFVGRGEGIAAHATALLRR